tara:strand:- start:214 stop:1485 length:1272 start_codon:yes stop_codon:yes gene_type:complete
MYKLIYIIITSLLAIFLPIIKIFNKKLKSRFKDEKNQYINALSKLSGNNKKIIWLHAASSGEFEQVVPILEKIDREKYFILLSFMSPTIFDIEKNNQLADAVVYHPLDIFWKAKSFIKDFRPSYYILNRHDIWPNHIYLAKEMGVKVVIINLNLHINSLRLYWLFKNFNKQIFSNFDKIYLGTKRLKSAASKLVNKNKIIITGDTRYNRVKSRKNKKNNLLPKKFQSTKNIIFGSIIESDYDLVFGGLHKKFPNGNSDLISQNIGLIITPHETDEFTIKSIANILTEIKIEYQLYTELMNEKAESYPNTIIIDTVGILADLYQYSRLSYVGAAFGAGVHNVLEPAVYGSLVSFGPNIFILDEAIDLYEKGLATMVHHRDDFLDYLDFLDSEKKYNDIKLKLKAFVEKRTCDIEKMLKDILDEN